MKNYQKPEIILNNDFMEGVYMSSGSTANVVIPAGHQPRPGSTVPQRLCMWFAGGNNDMTGVTVTVQFSCPVKFIEAHNFSATVISDNASVIAFKINSPAYMKDGNDDYNFSVDAVDSNDRPSFINATASGGANVKQM